MARTPSITDDEILDAAREVFLAEGFSGTTAEVAERAGISEGTIYRRFSEKIELFRAAMELPYPTWIDMLDDRVGEGDLRQNLIDISIGMVDFFEETIPKINMIMSAGDFDPAEDMIRNQPESPPAVTLRKFTEFFERERKLGRIQPCDPEIVARTLLGSFFHYAFAEHQGLNDIYPMPRQTFVRGVIDNTLHGLIGPSDADAPSDETEPINE